MANKLLSESKTMNIDSSYIFPVSIAGSICFFTTLGALFLVKRHTKVREANAPCFESAWRFAISRRALFGAGVMPVLTMILFYAFVVHVRLSLGRWPHFGESLTSQALAFHLKTAQYCILGLFFSLYATGIMTLIGFAFKSLRWLSFSCLLHMGFVALSFGSFFLAPHIFLNWLFD